MMCALIFIAVAALALAAGFKIAAVGLFFVALVLLVQQLPDSGCNQNCRQGDHCTCLQKRGLE